MMTEAEIQSPATKLDIALLMEEMGRLHRAFEVTRKELRERQHVWQRKMYTRMDAKFRRMRTDVIREFRVIAEDMRHDYDGIFKDRLFGHEDELKDHRKRIVRAELKMGAL